MNPYEERIHALMTDIFDRILVTEQKALHKGIFHDLSLSEMHALEAIGLYDRPMMSETAAKLRVTTGTLTVAVNRLVRKGYVDRQRDETDRRIVRIQLTRKGKLACRMHHKFHTLLVDRLVSPLDEDGRAVLLSTLGEIARFVEEQYDRYAAVPPGGDAHGP